MRTTLKTVALCALILAVPGMRKAAAQDEDAEITRMAKEHYKIGLDAFKAGHYPEAIKELKKAYLLKRLPPLLINIAKTYEKLNDPDNAIYYYKKYLAETPVDGKDRDTVKQAIAEVEAVKSGKTATPPPDEAPPPEATHPRADTAAEDRPPVKHKSPPPSDAPPPDDRAPPETAANPSPPESAVAASEWTHTPIDAVPPNQPLDVRVQTPVMKGVKVYLYYRGKGQADFTPVLMKRHGSEKIGRIPADMLAGKSIQYYIEAKDKTGNVLKNSGSQTDPNIVMVDAEAKAQIAGRGGEEVDEGEGGEVASVEPTPKASPPERDIDNESPDFKKGNGDNDSPPLRAEGEKAPPTAEKGTGKKLPFTTLGWVGLGLAAGGLGAIGAGTFFGIQAGKFANQVNGDAYFPQGQASPPTKCPGGGTPGSACAPFIFNDPAFSQTNQSDFNYDTTGKLYGILGPALIGVGAAMVVAGGAMVVADIIKQRPAAHKVIKKKRARHHRPVDEEGGEQPQEESAPPSDDRPAPREESSLIRNFIASPIISPTTVGLGAGFSF